MTFFQHKQMTSSSMPPPTQFYNTKNKLFYNNYTMLTTT